MGTKPTLRIRVPDSDKDQKYISFILRTGIINEPATFKSPEKLLLLSCAESKFSAFQKTLMGNKVIDRYGRWIFDEGHVVILGLGANWEEQAIECLWLLYSLEEKARRAGGYVHFIIGKHEVENIFGNWRFQHPHYAISSKAEASVNALYYGNNTIWQWLLTKNVAEKIGNLLFVQGGIPPMVNDLMHPLAEINRLWRSCYSSNNNFMIYNKAAELFSVNYSDHYDMPVDEEQIDTTLNKFGVTRIVTAHNTQAGTTVHYNGKVLNVNFSSTTAFQGGLFIVRNKYYSIGPDKSKSLIEL